MDDTDTLRLEKKVNPRHREHSDKENENVYVKNKELDHFETLPSKQ